MGCVYIATNHTNGKQYVGKTLATLRVRRRTHQRAAEKGSHLVFAKAIRKYGISGFTWTVAAESNDDDELCKRECELIRRFNTQVPFGYNMTAGGEGFRGHHSDETKAKLSACNKGKTISEDHKRKISRANKGRKHGPKSARQREHLRNKMLGRVLTQEWKDKIGAANRGRKLPPVTDETRAKLSAAHNGKKKTAKHLANISKALKGRRLSDAALEASAAARRGIPLTEEHKEKLRKASIGKTATAETREKLRLASTGRRHTAETKAKLVAARKRQVMKPPTEETKAKIAKSVKQSWKKRRLAMAGC